MNYDHYKAASERTDADERALIPGFKRTYQGGIWSDAHCNDFGQGEPEPPADADAAEALDQLQLANEGEHATD